MNVETGNAASFVPEVVLTQAFDAAGNRTSLAAEIGATDDFLSEYTYDDLGRMTRVQQSGQTGGNSVTPKRVDFAYDAASGHTGLDHKAWKSAN